MPDPTTQLPGQVAPWWQTTSQPLGAAATSSAAPTLASRMVSAAPALMMNGYSAGAYPETIPLAGLLNIGLEQVKNVRRFPERWGTPLLMIVASLAIGFALWNADTTMAVVRGAWIAVQAHANYHAGKVAGLLAPTDPANRFGGR